MRDTSKERPRHLQISLLSGPLRLGFEALAGATILDSLTLDAQCHAPFCNTEFWLSTRAQDPLIDKAEMVCGGTH
jgi:hypothetical protein